MKGSRVANEDLRLMTGLFPDRTSAERAYGSLTERGYTKDDVSLLMSEDARDRYFPKNDPTRTELGTKAAEGATAGAVTGGGLGALEPVTNSIVTLTISLVGVNGTTFTVNI